MGLRFQHELAKEKHDQELQELKAAISASKDPSSAGTSANGAATPQGKPAPAVAPFKLEGADVAKNLKPYVPDLTDFIPEPDVERHLSSLRQENELLTIPRWPWPVTSRKDQPLSQLSAPNAP